MIKLFNTLSRKKEVFKPIKKGSGPRGQGQVGLYTCGPTVYNYAHIGNLRTYIFEDILRRVLEQNGYKVKHVMNITDIDDKIIRDSKKAKSTIYKFTEPYEKVFFEDLRKLNIKKAWKYPKATSHIKEMIALIKILLSKKIAYTAVDGVYFSVSKFKNYGKLSGIKKGSLKVGARVSADEYNKEDAQDFALWKFAKEDEPSWPSSFGAGRPGWHIECSAMSTKYLGKTFDIHAGGVDLIFPHHENEIAQSESATGKKFVNYFLEGEHLLVNGEKMSKSLGNMFTLRDIESKKISPQTFRYFVLAAHYRSKLNFTWEALEASEKALERLYEFVRALNSSPQPPSSYSKRRGARGVALFLFQKKFNNAIYDDLNTPKALAVVWNLIHSYNKNPQKINAREILKLFYEFDEILGLGLKKIALYSERSRRAIPKYIMDLAQKREEFRKLQKWVEADKIREELKKSGYAVEDTSEGPKLSPTSALLA